MGLQLCLFVLGAIIYLLLLSYYLTLSFEHPSPINNPTLVVFTPVKRLLIVLTLSTFLILPSFSPPFNVIKLWTFNSPGLSLVCLGFHDLIQLKPYKPPIFKLFSSSQSTLHTVSFYLSSCLWSTYRQMPQKVKKRQPFLHSSCRDSPKPTLALWSQLHTSVNRKQMLNWGLLSLTTQREICRQDPFLPSTWT